MIDPTATQAPFHFIFIIAGAVIAVGFVVVIVLAVRNSNRIRQAGHDPLTLQSDLALKVMNSDLLSPEKPVADRLAELDALLASGAITEPEHAAARAKILGSL